MTAAMRREARRVRAATEEVALRRSHGRRVPQRWSDTTKSGVTRSDRDDATANGLQRANECRAPHRGTNLRAAACTRRDVGPVGSPRSAASSASRSTRRPRRTGAAVGASFQEASSRTKDRPRGRAQFTYNTAAASPAQPEIVRRPRQSRRARSRRFSACARGRQVGAAAAGNVARALAGVKMLGRQPHRRHQRNNEQHDQRKTVRTCARGEAANSWGRRCASP